MRRAGIVAVARSAAQRSEDYKRIARPPASLLADYAERVNYDPNGNIAFYNRHGNSGTNIDMDSMLYRYVPGTNKLDHVDDRVAATNYSVDIDDQDTLNYRYDQIGNLTRDTSEGIDSIKWTLYGKLQEIDKRNGDTIKFAYDPMGHRIMKEVYKDTTHRKKGTYYVHDATGNIMGTYAWQDRDTFKLGELMMYGSSRLGSYETDLLICDTVNNDSLTYAATRLTGSSLTNYVNYHTYGVKRYELSNHLGNVLATITDRHIPTYSGTVLGYYNADVASAQDYYPFGMQMPGRTFSSGYRFGFNGQEKDDDIIGSGNLNTAEFWEYDTRLGRRWNVDLKSNPEESSYSCLSNNPIGTTDPNGDKAKNGHKEEYEASKAKFHEAQAKFDKINKKLDIVAYRAAKKDLSNARDEFADVQRHYMNVQNKLDAIEKSKAAGVLSETNTLFDEANNAKDEMGNEIDVYIFDVSVEELNRSADAEISRGEGQDIHGITSAEPALYAIGANGNNYYTVVSKIDKRMMADKKFQNIPENAAIIRIANVASNSEMAHELGHFIYQVNFARAWVAWRAAHPGLVKGYGAHGKGDPSGEHAKKAGENYDNAVR